MVMPSKCPFCNKTYGDAEEHWCDTYGGGVRDRCTNVFCDYNIANGAVCRGKDCSDYFSDGRTAEEYKKTLIYQGRQADKALRDFSRVIMEEAIKSRKVLEKIFKKKD